MISKSKIDNKALEIRKHFEKLNVKLDHVYGHTQTEEEDTEDKRNQRRQRVAEDLDIMQKEAQRILRCVEELKPLVQI